MCNWMLKCTNLHINETFRILALVFGARIVKLWKEDLGKVNKKAADSLADPSEYENLFPEFQEALQAEKVTVNLRANGRNNSQHCCPIVVACYLLAIWAMHLWMEHVNESGLCPSP